jgi:methionyl-tRNA synthetase
MTMDKTVPFATFTELDLRVGVVTEAERVEGSEKLLRLQVHLGQDLGNRQIIAGIGTAYEPAPLVNTQLIVITNLEPRTLMGHESRGMLLAAKDEEGKPVLLRPDRKASHGSQVS